MEMAHSYKVGQYVRILNQITKIDHIIKDVPGGYTVRPRIVCGRGRSQCEIGSWNEDEMLPVAMHIEGREHCSRVFWVGPGGFSEEWYCFDCDARARKRRMIRHKVKCITRLKLKEFVVEAKLFEV